MSSLRVRFLVTVGTLVVTVLVVVGSLSSRVASEQMFRYLSAEDIRRADTTITWLRPPLEEFFLMHGTWLGVEDLLTELKPRVADAAILLLDSQLGYAAGSEPDLAGMTARWRADGGLHLSKETGPGEGGKAGTIELVVGNGWATLSDGHGGKAGILVVLPALGGLRGSSRQLAPSIRHKVMAIIAVAGALALAAIWWLAGRMLKPVGELTEAAREMAAGRLDRRVCVSSTDEIGRLSVAFNAMADSIERSEGLRRKMVSDVSHELRTPLTGIRCQLEALQDGLVTPEPEVINSLHEDIITLQRLVDDLQELAVAEAGGLILELQPVDLRKEVEAVRRSLANGTPGSIEVDIELLPPVHADAERLRQILRNLLGNASQHAGDDAHVLVTAAVDGDSVEVAVEDTGPGIPPEHLDLVFERFHRVEPSRRRQPGGGGLGLAITRQLVHAHGGEIRAENAPSHGARFVFTLPISSVTVPGSALQT